VAEYEQLRRRALAGRPDGWRLGWGELATRGVVAWITARTATPARSADAHGTAGTPSQALSLSTTTQSLPDLDPRGGEHSQACSSFLPAATADIIAVLAAITLAHAQLTGVCPMPMPVSVEGRTP
jgi:hypothetical protein